MKLFILGATGRTGQELVRQALSDGHEVVAYVRSPEKLNSQEKLTIIQGTLEETTKLQQAMMSCDAVLVALGNPIKDSSADLFASFMPQLIKIMRLAAVSRIIVLSSLGTGETISNVTYPYKIGVQTFLKGNQADHVERRTPF